MNPHAFAAYLGTVVSPTVVSLLTQVNGGDEIKAFETYYMSRVYVLLSDEKTKVWHYSPQLLADLIDCEARTGTFALPEEAS